MATQYDLVVRGGTVLDGTGGEPFAADVAVHDGRIAAVESGSERVRRRSTPAGCW